MGEKWRECTEAYILGGIRRCRYLRDRMLLAVVLAPKDCDGCDRPALVEGVEAMEPILGVLCDGHGCEPHGDYPGCPRRQDCGARQEMPKILAAIAALAKAKTGESKS